jgi:hypothetical protein
VPLIHQHTARLELRTSTVLRNGAGSNRLLSIRDDPQILGFRLELMRFRGIAAQAGNEEWVGRLDRAIDVLKNL